jgi:hypothetical protein
MDDKSDQELKSAIATGELSPRKEAIAKEVLRRRYDARGGGWLWTHLWLALIGALGLARLVLRRLRMRQWRQTA